MHTDSVRCLLALLLIFGAHSFAQSEIYRCKQADGTVAFQQMPCADNTESPVNDADGTENEKRSEGNAADSNNGAFDSSRPFDSPASPRPARQAEPATPISKNRAVCEKSTRDAIDAIDLELRKGFDPEKKQQHLDELLELTQQLRECKRL